MSTEIARDPETNIARSPNWSVVHDDLSGNEVVEVSLTFRCERDADGELVPRTAFLSIEGGNLFSEAAELIGGGILSLLDVREALESRSEALPAASPQVA